MLEQANIPGKTLHRLIAAYLRDFEPDAPGIKEATAKIREELAKAGPRLDTWRTAQNEVHLFDPARGPAALADCLLEQGKPPDEILARYKLNDPLLTTSNYMLAVEDAVRAQAAPLLRKSGMTALERILQIVAPTNVPRFKSHIADTGRALLRPWLDSGPHPAPSLQEPVRRVLLHWLGDPRLRLQHWAALGEKETDLIRRWLARASLNLFFGLIDDYALRAHWSYRHAFWLAYLERGAVSDAWLALGGKVYSSAQATRELGGAYARLRGVGIKPNHSALLLRIGSLIVVEFSHEGKLRAWLADRQGAPTLGHPQYDSRQFRAACLAFPPDPQTGKGGDASNEGLSHKGSYKGYWQKSAAALIERHAGIRITPSEWQPK
ncbi:MAG: EH signature domain-containing protein [Alloacidobacterium sp.]